MIGTRRWYSNWPNGKDSIEIGKRDRPGRCHRRPADDLRRGQAIVAALLLSRPARNERGESRREGFLNRFKTNLQQFHWYLIPMDLGRKENLLSPALSSAPRKRGRKNAAFGAVKPLESFGRAGGFPVGLKSDAPGGPAGRRPVRARRARSPFPLGSFRLGAAIALIAFTVLASRAGSFEDSFRLGTENYRAGNYTAAAKEFSQSAAARPASGTLQNLGVAEWHAGNTGPAVLAWEQALWLDPFDKPIRENLRYARKNAQLESPDLTWYEVVSTWLPANWWAWIAGVSFWLGIGLAALTGTFGTRRCTWHQALAALSVMVFLLSLPGFAGVHTRARIGFILNKDTSLRLTPTANAQSVTRLGAGDPARLVRERGGYLLVRTHHTLGWIERAQFGRTCPAS